MTSAEPAPPADSADQPRDEPTNEEIEEARPKGEERHYTGEPLETEEGDLDRPAQHPVGRQRSRGGGEFPDPRTPSQAPAPGAADRPAHADDDLEPEGRAPDPDQPVDTGEPNGRGA